MAVVLPAIKASTLTTIWMGGTTAAVLWGVNVLSSSRSNPSDDEFPQVFIPKKVYEDHRLKEFERKARENKEVLDTKTNYQSFIDGNDTTEKNIFENFGSQCAATFFSDLSWSKGTEDNHHIDERRQSLFGKNPTTLLQQHPSQTHISDDVQGCASMSLFNRGRETIFKSEVSITNSEMGMILWTAAKFENTTQNKVKVQVRQYIIFLKNAIDPRKQTGRSWKIREGFSWGGQSREILTDTLTITYPNGDTFTQSPKVTNIDNSLEVIDSYSGIWRPDNKGTSPMSFQKGWHKNKNMTLNPTIGRGFQETDSFYKPSNNGKNWKQYCSNKTVCSSKDSVVTLDTTSNIDAWFDPFENLQGTWI